MKQLFSQLIAIPNGGSYEGRFGQARSVASEGKLRAIVAASMLLAWIACASAQNYTIDWHTIDGGGGNSAGGVYAISGTLGQPDAGVATGGPYGLGGGFWSLVNVVQGPGDPNPRLGIELLPGRIVRVFWTRPATGRVLEEVGGLPATGWSLVAPSTYQTNATHIFITIPNSTGSRFYRLR